MSKRGWSLTSKTSRSAGLSPFSTASSFTFFKNSGVIRSFMFIGGGLGVVGIADEVAQDAFRVWLPIVLAVL